MVLPAGTYHATLNTDALQDADDNSRMNSTLAVGAQSAWSLEHRLEVAADLLAKTNGNSVGAHSTAGLSLAHVLTSKGGVTARKHPDMLKLAIGHLTTVLAAEPLDTRVAISLADLLIATDRSAEAVPVVATVGDALTLAVQEFGGSDNLEAAARMTLGSFFRRLG